jgi:uncharacterized SAM-binding protein YcdF (DUF218 family)
MSRSGVAKGSVLAAFVLIAVWLLSHAASFLVLNNPQHADVILVLEGAADDSRYWRAVQLAKEGYSDRVILDADASRKTYGKSEAELAAAFVSQTAPGLVQVCSTVQDSTYGETEDAQRCLAPLHVSSILIVTSDFHTRRALSIFKKRLPQYRWSIASTGYPYHFADEWWKHRRWAKAAFEEWQKYLWWLLVDQWRSNVVLRP